MSGEVPASVVYEAAHAVSSLLGGRTVVGSDELTERARELGAVQPERVVHAIFDGTEASAGEVLVPLDAEPSDEVVREILQRHG